MEKDYKNFVDRMGSFEDVINIPNDPEDIVKHLMNKNSETELSHVGVLGMKWGHHKNGTINNVKWTSSDGKSNNLFKMNANIAGKAAKTGQDLTSLGQTVNKGGFNKKTLKEAKNLSDDDLKQLTNRLNLENNYINAKQQQSGRGKVDTILSVAGGTLTVASSAAILYNTIKKFK